MQSQPQPAYIKAASRSFLELIAHLEKNALSLRLIIELAPLYQEKLELYQSELAKNSKIEAREKAVKLSLNRKIISELTFLKADASIMLSFLLGMPDLTQPLDLLKHNRDYVGILNEINPKLKSRASKEDPYDFLTRNLIALHVLAQFSIDFRKMALQTERTMQDSKSSTTLVEVSARVNLHNHEHSVLKQHLPAAIEALPAKDQAVLKDKILSIYKDWTPKIVTQYNANIHAPDLASVIPSSYLNSEFSIVATFLLRIKMTLEVSLKNVKGIHYSSTEAITPNLEETLTHAEKNIENFNLLNVYPTRDALEEAIKNNRVLASELEKRAALEIETQKTITITQQQSENAKKEAEEAKQKLMLAQQQALEAEKVAQESLKTLTAAKATLEEQNRQIRSALEKEKLLAEQKTKSEQVAQKKAQAMMDKAKAESELLVKQATASAKIAKENQEASKKTLENAKIKLLEAEGIVAQLSSMLASTAAGFSDTIESVRTSTTYAQVKESVKYPICNIMYGLFGYDAPYPQKEQKNAAAVSLNPKPTHTISESAAPSEDWSLVDESGDLAPESTRASDPSELSFSEKIKRFQR